MGVLESKPSAGCGAKSVPKYVRVHDRLREEIRSGKLAPGQSLPAEAKLMEELGISRFTVRQALAELETGGFIERIQGKGTFVTTAQQRQAQQQLDIFALIAPQLREGMYPSLVQGFEQAGAACQHQVMVSNSGNDVSRQGDLVLQMIDRLVGGVALVPATATATPAYQINQLQQHHIPVVFCHRSVEGTSAPCVAWSGPEVGRTAAKLLLKHGHTNIACVLTHQYIMSIEFEQGFRDALSQRAAAAGNFRTVFHRNILPGAPAASEAIRQALEQLFAEAAPPTAIFCGNLPDAEQVYLHAIALGRQIPRDLSLVYFGGTWRDHGLAEKISCVAVDEYEVGGHAAQLLWEMRSGKRPLESNERIEFPIVVLPGETVGPVPQRSRAESD